MARVPILLTAFAFALLLGPAAASDRIPPDAYARVNAALVENHVVPRYQPAAFRAERSCLPAGARGAEIDIALAGVEAAAQGLSPRASRRLIASRTRRTSLTESTT